MSTSSISRTELLERRLRGLVKPRKAADIVPVPRDGALRLSFAQRRMWALDQIRPGSTDYLMAMLLRLRGEVDLAALRRALDEIVARHEVLRTRYAAADGEPVQLVDAPGPLPFRVVDLRDDLRDDAERRLTQLVAGDGAKPFDLAAEWPVRALLVRLTDTEQALLLTLHHIANDGWSESVLLSELDALYAAFATGAPSPLEAMPVQYADYAAWQRARLSGARLAEQLDYWRTTLGDLAPLELPTDRPRRPVRDASGAVSGFHVPANVAAALTRIGREQGATPFMVMLAAFQLLLGRYSGQTDIAVGSPVAGRDNPEVHGLIGLFINTVVLRTDLSGPVSFRDVLGRVRETALGAYAHQDTPFERLVDELAVERDAGRNPLFQVLFQFDADEPAEARAMRIVREPVPWNSAKFDLSLSLSAKPDGSLSGALLYATALFDAATAAGMCAHFVRLLESIAAEPDARASSLQMLTDGERAQLLDRAGPGEDYAVAESLGAAFQAQAHRTPHAVAVSCGDTQLTYAELNTRANRLAHRLHALGVGPDTLVGVCLDRSVDLVVALTGVLKAGAGYLPLAPGQPTERLAYMLTDAAVSVVVTAAGAADWLADAAVTTVLLDEEPAGVPDTDPVSRALPDHVAYVIYTSGSTGKPKGVPVPHRNVLRLLRSCEADFGFGADDVWSMFHTYAFDFSVWEMWGALLYGGRVVVVPFATSRSPQDFLDLLIRERVTILSQTPSAFRGLVEAATETDVAPERLALRAVVFGGEALDLTDLEPWFARFGDERPAMVNMYGITETTVHVTYRVVRAGEAAVRRRSPIGRPLGDLRVYLLDGDLNPVPIGVPGQIYVSGAGLARGYLNRPDLTADRFGPDPYSPVPGARMYRSGDVARYGRDGDLEFLGRADDQVEIRGHRIEPAEVEAAITGHPGVEKSLVVAHRRAGERADRLVAYYVPVAGDAVDAAALRDHIGRVLPSYMVPALLISVDGIPLTANGKADRKALPDPDAYAVARTDERVAPRTAVERVIAETWAEALGAPEIGVHDNFFAFGGDSIRAIRAVGGLRRRGIQVSVEDLLVHQTIDEFARLPGCVAPATVSGAEERRVGRFELIDEQTRASLPPDVADAYPLAMVQAAMLYQMIADADECPYHNITLFPMADDRPFSLPALRESAAVLGRRHEILRTGFDLTGHREPLQLVYRDGIVEVGYHDLRGLTSDEAREALDRFVADERSRPFDVATPPLVRFNVHQTADDHWTFSFTECHAALDGWSAHLLISELLANYRSIRDGDALQPVDEHTVRFADFVAAEKRALESADDREFWRDRLARFDRLELPEGWAAPPGTAVSTHKRSVAIADLEPGLRALAAAAGVPLKSVFFAAHMKVLSVIGGARRFHTGLVTNGRLETHGGERVRGMHLNTMPVGVDVTAATWTELAQQAFAEEVATWPHRRFPLPEMQRLWGGGTPLVDTAFTYLDFHVLDMSRIESDKMLDVSPNEFALDVWTFPGFLWVAVRSDRIDRDHARQLTALYRRVLEAMAADPSGDVNASVVDADEAARLFSFATGPEVDYPHACLHELVERQVARTPEAPALLCADGAAVSYAELNDRANRLASHLRSLGVGVESRAGVLLRRGPDLVVALLAVLKAGAAYVPLDPNQPARRLSALLDEAGATVVVTTTALVDRVTDAGATAVLVDADERIADQPSENLGRTATPDCLAYVIYTSGSTGVPKGVMVEHRNLVNYVAWCLDTYTPLGGSGSPLYSSVAFDLPVTSVFPALLSGQAVTITEDDGTPGIDALVAALERGGFGLLKLTPSHLAVLNQSLSPSAFRTAAGRLVAGGEELTREMVTGWARHAPDIVVDNEYGPTETTVGCSWIEGTAGDLAAGVLPIGRPFANTSMRVLDADLRLVPVGVVGELYIGGAQLARGYVGRPDLTAERFVPDPYAAVPGQRLYRSGDLARYRDDGVLEFAGRVDTQVKVRGYRVELGEIEAALRQHADLRAVAVRPVDTPAGERELVAYLVPADDADVDPAALPGLLSGTLPAYMVPAAYLVLDALPMTASGKVDTAALPAPPAHERSVAYQAPRTALETVLAKAWAQVLGVPKVGINDSFVELGGHSMAVMRVIVKLREEHGIRVSFRDFYEHRTVAQLAGWVESGTGSDLAAESLDALVWLRRGGTRAPLFCVHPSSSHWFAELTEHLGPDQPVGAFEWPGLHRPHPEPESVEHIAAVNVAQLRRVAPVGPYRLLGWCGGGIIAGEMAQLLLADGADVTLFLLDPALDVHERDNNTELLRLFEHTEAVLTELLTATGDDVPRLQREAVIGLERIVDDRDSRIDPPPPGDDFWLSRVHVWHALHRCRYDYRHRPYPGRLHLVVGDELAAGEHDVVYGQSFVDYVARWAELAAGGVETHRVGGTHFSVLRAPNVGGLAELLTGLLDGDRDGTRKGGRP